MYRNSSPGESPGSRPNRARLAALVVLVAGACAPTSRPVDEARSALERNDPDRAYAVLDSLLTAGDTTPEAYTLMAIACLRTMRTARGAAAAARAVVLAPNDPAAHRARACLEQRRLENLTAVEAATEAVRLAPEDAKGHALLGQLRLSGGRVGGADYDLAERAFRRALELSPGLASARLGLAHALVEAGDANEALRLLDELLRDGYATADVRYWRGLAFSRTHDFHAAETAFRDALAIDPTKSAALFNLARALRMNGEDEEAAAIHEQYARVLERERHADSAEFAFHSQPGAVRAALDLAPQLAISGRIDEALRVLDTVCIDDPDRPEAHLLRATIAASAHDSKRAQESVARALALAPDDAATLGVAARIELGREQYADALAHADAARERNPDDLESALVCARSLTALGRPAEAVALLDPISRRIPGPRVLTALGEALVDVGSPEAAERVLTAAIQKRGAAGALAARGRALAAQSRWRPAKEDLLAAIEADPTEPQPYEDLVPVLRADEPEASVEPWRKRAESARQTREELRSLRTRFAADPRDADAANALAAALKRAGLDQEAARIVNRVRSSEVDPCRN